MSSWRRLLDLSSLHYQEIYPGSARAKKKVTGMATRMGKGLEQGVELELGSVKAQKKVMRMATRMLMEKGSELDLELELASVTKRKEKGEEKERERLQRLQRSPVQRKLGKLL